MSKTSKHNYEEEAKLIELSQKGDEKAFGKIVQIYKDRVYRYCYYLCSNEQLAEDLTQEAFCRAIKSLHTIKKGILFCSWMHTIALRTFLDYKKLHKNRPYENLENIEEPSDKPKALELKSTIHQALDSLEPDEKNALLLVDIGENSYEEAAQIMKVSLQTLHWKVREARRKFIDYFKRHKVEVTGLFVLPKKTSA